MEQPHEYWLGMSRLAGVTSMLGKMLPEQYPDIPRFVLDRAAAEGTALHNAIETVLSAPEEGTIERAAAEEAMKDERVRAALGMIGDAGLRHEASEYLVSDERVVASKIDFVGTRDGEIVIGDYKGTSEYHRESVTYQLNTYRVLFELQNPGLKVGAMVCFHLPKKKYGSPRLHEVEKIGDDVIWDMIRCFRDGLPFTGYVPVGESDPAPPALAAYGDAVLKLLRERADAEKRLADANAGLAALSDEISPLVGDGWKTSAFTVSRRQDHVRRSFDARAAKASDPEGYGVYENYISKYQKETLVKGGLQFKIN